MSDKRFADPVQTWPPELLLRARGMRVAIFDVDGVLTDGGLYYGAQGEAIKRFSTLDGLGLKLLRRGGIEPVVISGRDSPALRARLDTLALARVTLGVENKLPAAEKVLADLQAGWEQTAVIGDDWPDLPLFARAALACAPANAHPEARARAHHVTPEHGGAGAARAFCDLLLAAAGRYRALLDEYTGAAGARS
jgi:3-deoxy-D-manno-octulosonate 8-phosphate phosphatase (KDO 8-P phosphatase)